MPTGKGDGHDCDRDLPVAPAPPVAALKILCIVMAVVDATLSPVPFRVM